MQGEILVDRRNVLMSTTLTLNAFKPDGLMDGKRHGQMCTKACTSIVNVHCGIEVVNIWVFT